MEKARVMFQFWLLVMGFGLQAQNKLMMTVDSVPILQAMNPAGLYQVAFVRGYTNALDADGFIVYYNSASSAATNTTSVFKPASSNGRWVRQDIPMLTGLSVGNLSPLFTSSVASPTLNPSVTFALSSVGTNLVFAGPNGGVSGVPTFRLFNLASDPTGTLPISHGGTSGTTAATGFDALSPMTTLGDLIYGGASGTRTRLGIGSAGQILSVSGGLPAWTTAAGTGDWTLGTGTITGPAAGSILTVGALTIGSSAGNANVIVDPHGTGKLQFNIATGAAGPFKIISDETAGSGTNSITWYPDLGTTTYGAGVSLYGYAHASKPGQLWLGYGGTGKISFGNGSDAVAGTARAEIDGTSFRDLLTTTSISSITGSLIVGNGTAATTVGIGAGKVNIGAGLAVGGHITIGGSTSTEGAVTSETKLIKAISGISDAVATDILTVTIPNAAHSAGIRLKIVGSLGAGGVIGANEASVVAAYDIVAGKTAGQDLAHAISPVYGTAFCQISAGATITATCDFGATSGAVGATQTFPIRVTITKGSGSSNNHTCLVVAELMNANATGVTIQ